MSGAQHIECIVYEYLIPLKLLWNSKRLWLLNGAKLMIFSYKDIKREKQIL